MYGLARIGLRMVWFLGSACVLPGIAEAESGAQFPPEGTFVFKMTADKGSELQVEARQMPLAAVLESLTKQTKTPIHYSILPEGLLTATCVGSSLKPVLECLLDRKADIIVRYQNNNDAKVYNSKVAEAWVLGSKLETVNKQACTSFSNNVQSVKKVPSDNPPQQTEEIEDILNKAKSTNPNERAEAVGALLGAGDEGNPNIKAALDEALHDKDASVRAQAVSTLAHRSDTKDTAQTAIREALQDSSTDVRRMAVDAITDDAALLQQAVNDNDEFIRNLAAVKLQQLSQAPGK